MADRFLIGNGIIEEAIAGYQQEASAENIARILNGFRKRMNEDGHLMMPVEMSEAGDESFEWLSMTGDDGKSAFVVFTSEYEANKGPKAQFLSQDMHQILKYAMNMECEGIMLNPFGKRFLITKAGLAQILEVNKEMKDGRHLDVVQGDITTLKVDAIVNAANSSLLGGGGVDGAIHRAAGMELLKECETLGGCNPGEAKLTKGYNLDAKFVIHTVGPIYSGSAQDAVTLANCYRNSLNLARENDVHTIAFPSISTGVYGYPVAEAAFVACKTILEWLSSNKGYAMDVTMVCFDGKTFSSYDMASGLINAYTHADEYLLEAMKDGLSPTVYTDWKINEMPEETASGVLQREMSARDLEVLSFGHIPQEMEDKWFWYADNGKLYAYRNGSGNFVFALDFLEGAVENKIHVILNNDDEQREWTDLDEELHHVEALLNEWCKLNYDYYEQWLEEKRRIEDKPEALIEMDLELVTHNFTPIYDEHSRILMLGTMPSPKSREVGFYYGHPRNRFWKVVSAVCGEELPLSTEAKIDFALRNHIAVWDVLAGCEIKGADDSSIRNPRPNDLRRILKEADIRAIFATGQKAAQLYKRYCYKDTGMEIICLPSTSPANCRVSDEELFDAYRVITKYL